MPQSRSDINLEGEWATTLDGNEFIIANDGPDDKIVIFGTSASLRLLLDSSSFFVDGTFSVCPSLFYQLVTIHIMKHGQTFPMVYALFLSKQAAPNLQSSLHAFKRCCFESWPDP